MTGQSDDSNIAALELLSELFPDRPLEELYDALAKAKWNSETAANALLLPKPKPGKRSIKDFFGGQAAKEEKPVESPRRSFFTPPTKDGPANSPERKSVLDALSWKEGAEPKKARQVYYNVVLNTAELVALHMPSCTIHPNFLPDELADSILRFMISDSESKSWKVPSYVIFDKDVSSSHTSATYVTNFEQVQQADKGLVFGGRYLPDVRRATPDLIAAKTLIEKQVNDLLCKRPRHPLELQGDWNVNTVLANSYRDADSSVGFHTDRMTHIGPRPTIASLTLGATRVFCLRPTDREDNPDPTFEKGTGSYPSYLIPLPHNSLLIMHPPTQEFYKHSVPKLTSNLPQLKRHPISGTERINLTFRCYRPDYNTDKIPSCECGNKMDLQCAFNKDKEREKYFFTCAGVGGHGKKVGERCETFRWLKDGM